MRTVKIATGQFDLPQTVETDATTWGDLKLVLDEKGIDHNKRVVVKSTRADLVEDEAVLPEGDFIIFMYPTKNDSGVDVPSFTKLSFKELKQLARELGVSTPKVRDEGEVRARLNAYYVGVSSVGAEVEAENAYNGMMDMLKDIKLSIDEVKASKIADTNLMNELDREDSTEEESEWEEEEEVEMSDEDRDLMNELND